MKSKLQTKDQAGASLNRKQQVWQLHGLIGGYEWVAAVAATRLIKPPPVEETKTETARGDR